VTTDRGPAPLTPSEEPDYRSITDLLPNQARRVFATLDAEREARERDIEAALHFGKRMASAAPEGQPAPLESVTETEHLTEKQSVIEYNRGWSDGHSRAMDDYDPVITALQAALATERAEERVASARSGRLEAALISEHRKVVAEFSGNMGGHVAVRAEYFDYDEDTPIEECAVCAVLGEADREG
jgi:hypothetical protein